MTSTHHSDEVGLHHRHHHHHKTIHYAQTSRSIKCLVNIPLLAVYYAFLMAMNKHSRKHSNHVVSHIRLLRSVSRIHVYRLLVSQTHPVMLRGNNNNMHNNKFTVSDLSLRPTPCSVVCKEKCKSSKLCYRLSRILGTHGTTGELDR